MALVRGGTHPSVVLMATDVSLSNCEHSIQAVEEEGRFISGLSSSATASRSYDRVAPLLYGMIIKVVPCAMCADHIFKKVFHSAFASSVTNTLSTADLVRRAFAMIVEIASRKDKDEVISRIAEVGSSLRADRLARA